MKYNIPNFVLPFFSTLSGNKNMDIVLQMVADAKIEGFVNLNVFFFKCLPSSSAM